MIDEPILFLIDANIPMYASGKAHTLKEPCLRILKAIAQDEINAVTDVEVLQEIMHRYTALNLREKGIEVCHFFLQVVSDVLPVTREVIDRAMKLHIQFPQFQARDSLHAAVMLEFGIGHIISADKHFDGVAGITRVDPLQINLS